jgi:hypothetical protein
MGMKHIFIDIVLGETMPCGLLLFICPLLFYFNLFCCCNLCFCCTLGGLRWFGVSIPYFVPLYRYLFIKPLYRYVFSGFSSGF